MCWIAGAFAATAVSPGAITTVTLAALAAVCGGLLGWFTSRAVQRVRTVALGTIGAAAVLMARATVHQQGDCRAALMARIATGLEVWVVFDDRVAPRQTSRGVASAAGLLSTCRVPLVARVSKGAAPPGVWQTMRGRALETSRGLRIDGSIEPLTPRRTDWRRMARGRTGEIIDRDFGSNAALVRALLIADQDGIPPQLRDTFADAGLVHMLSISGLHVAIIAGALLTLAGAMRLSRSAAFGAALVVIVLYVAMLGAPPPAVRSAVMLAVVGVSERLQRPTHPWTALALGAVIPTIDPVVVLDLGWQLSVSGMAALVAARAMLRRLRFTERYGRPPMVRRLLRAVQELDGWRYGMLREFLTGLVATVVTAPLIAWTFGRVSVVAPVSNIVAGPLVAFIQPALFLALLASPWPALAQFIAAATEPPLLLLGRVAELSAAVPYASLQVAPTALAAACMGVASAAFVRATASHRWLPGLVVAAVALTLAVWAPFLTRGSGRLELHVLDVGQGDALAVRTPRGRWVLVDAGRRWDGGDAGRRTVVPYVRRLGGEVAAFVLSHAHDDHVGGAASVVGALRPQGWWEPAFVTTSEAYRKALEEVRQRDVSWRRARPGDRFSLDDVEFRIIAPDSAWTARQVDANETSVVMRVSFGRVSYLLTGDAEGEEEAWILQHTDPEMLRADVLKLGHHGSKTSSSVPFVRAISPRVAVASVGQGNRYGHPSPETLETLLDRGVPVLRTDLEGTVVISTDGKDLQVHVGRERWPVPSRAQISRAALARDDP